VPDENKLHRLYFSLKSYVIFQAGYPTIVALRDKIYFFKDYDIDGNLTSIGPFDVQVFRTGTIKYYSELVIRIVYIIYFFHFTLDIYQWSIFKHQNVSLDEMLPHLVHWHTAVVYKDSVWKFFISFLNLKF